MTSDVPEEPDGVGPAGSALWRAVVDDFELAEHELTLLRQAVRVADLCEELQAVVVAEGPMTTTRLGESRTHPAVVELRNQRALLARLCVSLRVPIGDQEAGSKNAPVPRAQRRGLRGFQGGAA